MAVVTEVSDTGIRISVLLMRNKTRQVNKLYTLTADGYPIIEY